MKLVILDRDGVINKESNAYIRTPEEWLPIPGSLVAIAQLTRAGFIINVATNQSGVGRGYFTLETLHAIHAKMLAEIRQNGGEIKHIYFCPHLPSLNCSCRKPNDGMFLQMEKDLNITVRNVRPFFIGDSLRDVELGLKHDCRVFLVISEDGHGSQTLHKITPDQKERITIVHDLAAATKQILAMES